MDPFAELLDCNRPRLQNYWTTGLQPSSFAEPLDWMRLASSFGFLPCSHNLALKDSRQRF